MGSDSPSDHEKGVWLGLQYEGERADTRKDFLVVSRAVARDVWELAAWLEPDRT